MGRPPKYNSLEERQEARRNQCRLNQRAWRARVAAVKDDDASSKAEKEGSHSSLESPGPPPALTTQSSTTSSSSLPTPPATNIVKRHRPLVPLLHARELRPLLYSTSSIASSPTANPNATSLELRSLDYYRSVVLGRLQEAFPSPIWGEVILPASYTNSSAIMHAIAGYSQAHESSSRALPVALEDVALKSTSPAPGNENSSEMQDIVTAGSASKSRPKRSAFELSQINKAIRALVNEQAKDSPDGAIEDSRLEMVLTVCLIFVFQEIMCEDYDAALIHLEHGIDLIIRWRDRRHARTSSNRNNETLLALLSMLQRVDLVASCWGNGHVMKLVAKEEELDGDYPPFNSLYQAGNRLYRILHHFFAVESAKGTNQFSHNKGSVAADTARLPSETIATLRQERAKLLEYFTRWQSTFDNFVSRRQLPALTLTPPASRSASATPVLVLTPLPSSNKPHTFLAVFKAAIGCAEAHNMLCAKSSPTGKSWIDMSSVAPLYFTAMQCPDRAEQDESFNLLKNLVKRECFLHDESAFTWSAGQAVDVG